MGVLSATDIANLRLSITEITTRLAAADSQGVSQYEINGRMVRYDDDLVKLKRLKDLLAEETRTTRARNLVKLYRR